MLRNSLSDFKMHSRHLRCSRQPLAFRLLALVLALRLLMGAAFVLVILLVAFFAALHR